MNKKSILSLGLLAVVGSGLFGLNIYGNQQAEKAVSDALYDVKLERFVQYDAVSHNVFSGVTTISDVIIEHKAFAHEVISVSEVNISDVAYEGREITALTMHVEDAIFPVLDIAKACVDQKCANGQWARTMVAAGYQNIPADFTISFDGDHDNRSFDLSAAAHSDVLGEVEFALAFDAIDVRRLFEASDILSRLSKVSTKSGLAGVQTAFAALADMQQVFEHAALSSISFEIKDNGFREAAFELDRLTNYKFRSGDEIAIAKASLARSNIEKDLENAGLKRSLAREYADKVGAFLEEGGRLTFTTDIDRPLTIFEQGGLFGIMPSRHFKSIADFLSASGAELDHS